MWQIRSSEVALVFLRIGLSDLLLCLFRGGRLVLWVLNVRWHISRNLPQQLQVVSSGIRTRTGVYTHIHTHTHTPTTTTTKTTTTTTTTNKQTNNNNTNLTIHVIFSNVLPITNQNGHVVYCYMYIFIHNMEFRMLRIQHTMHKNKWIIAFISTEGKQS